MNETVWDRVQGHSCFLVSADAGGSPHLAVAEVEGAGSATLDVGGWFCPQTLTNLSSNANVAVAVRLGEEGYQFAGRVEETVVEAAADGFYAEDEPVPNVKYRLRVRVARVMHLTERPHSDAPLPD
jgi:hypothetical protein